MGLQINRLSKGDNDMVTSKTAAVRVYRTVDGEYVGEGDPRGAFLAYSAGATIAAGDVARYDAFMSNQPQDAADGKTKGAQAYTDEETRDLLRRRQAGDPAARAALGESPTLVHDALATELADEAAAIAAMSPEDIAALRNEQDPDGTYAAHAVWRTADGDLVHEGDGSGVTVAYPAGARIDDADVDEYNDLGDPPKPDADATPKAATTPANKARKPAANK